VVWEEANSSYLNRFTRYRLSASQRLVLEGSMEAASARKLKVRVPLLEQNDLILLHFGVVIPLMFSCVAGVQFVLLDSIGLSLQVSHNVVVWLNSSGLIQHGQGIVFDRMV